MIKIYILTLKTHYPTSAAAAVTAFPFLKAQFHTLLLPLAELAVYISDNTWFCRITSSITRVNGFLSFERFFSACSKEFHLCLSELASVSY